MHAMRSEMMLDVVYRLRDLTGGIEPWSESGPDGQRGGFAWTDRDGHAFDVVIRPTGSAAPRACRFWKTVELGNDFAFLTDQAGWRMATALQYDATEREKK
ncbi:hypothetical protein [Iodidimonas sp. SYSU 1G8]|uniref:hypothetical protein n=1 Tax=Iodidimonas sp. SYSU 1G8 TaxID=3133967 RepID=UPI0031FF0AAC